MDSARQINQVRYLGLDFDTILDELRTFALVRFGPLGEEVASDLGQILLEYFSYAMDSLAYYLDRRASESYLATARLRENVAALARNVGYKLRGAVPSATDISITLNQTYPFDVVFPEGYRFETPTGLAFSLTQETTISAGLTEAEPSVTQGALRSESFVSDGSGSQVFELRQVPDDQQVAQGSLSVTVDSADWTEVPFLDVDSGNAFESSVFADPPTVRFGDNVLGNIPAASTSIVVTYRACNGTQGNVRPGRITGVPVPLVISGETIAFSATNPARATGGENRETLREARGLAGRVFLSRRAAITADDYESLSQAYADPTAGRVAAARATVAREASIDLTSETILRNIEADVAPIDGYVSTAQSSLSDVQTGLDSARSTLQAAVNSAGNATSAASANVVSSQSAIRQGQTRLTDVDVDATDIKDEADAGLALLSTLTPGDPLSSGDLDTLTQAFNRINGEVSNLQAASSDVRTSLVAASGALGTTQSALDDLGGPSVADTDLFTIATIPDAIDTQSAAVASISVQLGLDFDTIEVEVDAETAALRRHLDEVLSKDCEVNLVSVSILSRDEGGFYAPPSNLLLRSLQSYLDELKEVTQLVRVVSGAPFLLRAVVQITAQVEPTVVARVVQTALRASVEGVLRDRAFGADLNLDELYDATQGVDGVNRLNLRILGVLDDSSAVVGGSLDANGNLVATSVQVVTRGEVRVETESRGVTT